MGEGTEPAIDDAAALLGVEVIAGCQDALVAAGKADDTTRLRAALRGLGAAVDNKNAVRRAEKRDEGRWLDIAATFDGAASINGVLNGGGDESGAIVQAAIDSMATPAGPDDTRTPAQRRADALVELCRRQLNNGALRSQGGQPTHVSVVVGLETLQAQAGGFTETGDGSILRGETARRVACDAEISRIVAGPASQPLDVGRSQRTATPAQRKALRLRDGGCRFPGCDRPAEWTDAHHVVHWAHGGATDLNNLILLCRKHHTAVHEGGWSIISATPGQFRFIDPNGCPVPDDPPRSVSNVITSLIDTTGDPPEARAARTAQAIANPTPPETPCAG